MEQQTLRIQEYKREDQLAVNKPFPLAPPQYQNIEQALSSILPSPVQEVKVNKTRKILGETSQTFTDEQIQTITAEFQYLVDSWLDEFEMQLFEGKTLKELLEV